MGTPKDPPPSTVDGINDGVKKKVTLALAALAAMMVVGLAGILWFAHAERQRDIRIVQARMSVVADSRAEALHTWLRTQFDVLTDLARNESLQIYTVVVGLGEQGGAFADEPAHLAYLRTLLTASAQRTGFRPAIPVHDLPANIAPSGGGGLALVDPKGRVIIASPDMPPLEGTVKTALDSLPTNRRGLIPPHRATDGTPTVGFVVPVLARGGADGGRRVIARVVGLRPWGAEAFATLRQPGETAETAQSYAVRLAKSRVQYLTPLLDGTGPLEKALALDPEALVAAAAVVDPGRFLDGLNHAATEVFAMSRAIPDTDWVLVHTLDRAEALAASTNRRTTLVTVLVLVVLLVGAGLVAVWRHATSTRAQEAADRFRASSERFQSLSRFLDIVTDSQPHALFVTDANQTLTFVNRRAAEIMGAPKADVIGRALVAILGQDRGRVYAKLAGEVLVSGQDRVHTAVVGTDGDGEPVIWRSSSSPLKDT